MARNEKKKSYPYVPTKNWWTLRDRFIKSPPKKIDADYLSTVLGLGVGAAANLVSPLRAIGLLDDDLKPTRLAEDWRSDEHYADACRTILENVYPDQLRDALGSPDPDRDATEKWFMRNTGAGQAAAGKMASFYRLLAEANPNARTEPQAGGGKTAAKAKAPAQKKTGDRTPKPKPSVVNDPPAEQKDNAPSVHVDVQIHIPSDATAEQIDLIFASMAKHFYPKR